MVSHFCRKCTRFHSAFKLKYINITRMYTKRNYIGFIEIEKKREAEQKNEKKDNLRPSELQNEPPET